MRELTRRRASSAVTLETLSPRKQAFVRAYLDNLDSGNIGRGSITDAVQAAGISPDNRAAARVRASELMRDPEVLDVLHNEQIRKLNAGSALGVAVLIDLARTAKSETVKLQAASQLVDRSPIGPVISKTAALTANVSIEEMLERLGNFDDRPVALGVSMDLEAPEQFETDDKAEVVETEFRPVDQISQRWAAEARQARTEELSDGEDSEPVEA